MSSSSINSLLFILLRSPRKALALHLIDFQERLSPFLLLKIPKIPTQNLATLISLTPTFSKGKATISPPFKTLAKASSQPSTSTKIRSPIQQHNDVIPKQAESSKNSSLSTQLEPQKPMLDLWSKYSSPTCLVSPPRRNSQLQTFGQEEMTKTAPKLQNLLPQHQFQSNHHVDLS